MIRPTLSAGRGLPRAARGRALLLLSCAAAAILCGGAARAAVTRLLPEEKYFSTEPRQRFLAFLYAPKVPETGRLPDVTPVIFYAGEWGWRPLQQDTASYLVSTGRFVLGIDPTEYFTKIVTTEGLADDLAKFRSYLNERAGRRKDAPVILVGFASGAEVIPYLVNRAGAAGVKGAVLIAPDAKGAKVFRVSIQLRLDSSPEETFDVAAELGRMAPLPVVLVEGSLDTDSAARTLADSARGPHKYAAVEGGDRQFHDARDGFFSVLSEALRWIDATPAGAAPAAPSAPGAPPDPATPRAAPAATPGD